MLRTASFARRHNKLQLKIYEWEKFENIQRRKYCRDSWTGESKKFEARASLLCNFLRAETFLLDVS